MTETEKGNNKIALFLDMQKTKIGWFDSEDNLNLPDTNDNTFHNLLFHKDYNWLMSVVDFIENMEDGIYQVDILQEGCIIRKRCGSPPMVDKTVSNVPNGTTKKESIWLAIVEFFNVVESEVF